MKMRLFDDRVCNLGEGPLWHPERGQLFWFDIHGKRLLTRNAQGPRHWDMGENVSAAGWTGRNTLLIASENALVQFDLTTGEREHIAPLEADNPVTRSNDGRADPWGGFWIGTMGKHAEPGAGAIYRLFRGALRRLYQDITVSNGICFAPDRRFAYFADTPTHKVMRQALATDEGWPVGAPEPFLDLSAEALYPDGAVVDANGTLWIAQWGAARVAAYGPDGRFLRAVEVDALQSSCPAFGGPELTTLFCTSAAVGLPAETRSKQPSNGMTFAAENVAQGQPEHRVIL